MSLRVTSQQTTPSEVHARDFAWPPVVATFLSNFQSCGVASPNIQSRYANFFVFIDCENNKFLKKW